MRSTFKNLSLPFLSVFVFLQLQAQVITVKDIYTRKPIEVVTVYCPKYAVITNFKGQVDISSFAKCDSLNLQMIGYRPLLLAKKDIEIQKYVIYMTPVDFSLEEVVVTASRWKQERKDLPAKISSIKKEDVFLINPQTAADLLAMSGDVFIQKSQLGGGSPIIRGFATNRVLITVDGVRMNNAIFRGGNIQNVLSIDPFIVEKTEIVFGPGAIMFGSDAIGGAMNFVSLEPKFSNTEKSIMAANAFTRYSTAAKEKSMHVDISMGFKKLAMISSISFNSFDNLKAGSKGPAEFLRPEYVKNINGYDSIVQNSDSRIQTPSAYDQISLMQKFRYAPNEFFDIQYALHYSRLSDLPRYDRLIEYRKGKLRDAQWYYGPQIWMMNVLNMQHEKDMGVYNKMRLTFAHQFFEESRHYRSLGSSPLIHRTEQLDAFSFNFDFDKDFSNKQSLFYGFEFLNNNVSSFAEEENIKTQERKATSTRYPDGANWNAMAIYVNYLHKKAEKLSWQSGLRYSHFIIDALIDTSFFPFPFHNIELNRGALNASTGMAWRPTSKWQFNLNFSTGFRAPNIDDMGKIFESEPGAVIIPNPDLRAEYAYNPEIGIVYIFSHYLKSEFNAFYTYLDHALVRRDFQFNGQDSIMYDGEMSRVMAIQNAASAYVMGLQASIEAKLPAGFSFVSKFTMQRGEEELDDGSRASLRHVVPWFGQSRLIYNTKRFQAEFYALYQSEISYQQLAASERAKTHLYAIDPDGNPYSPSWVTFNLKTMYHLFDFLSVNAGVENLFDVLYRPYSSGISAPGRNFVFSIRGSF